MAYKINPNFAKHMKANDSQYKFIVKSSQKEGFGDSSSDTRIHKQPIKMLNFLNKDNFEEVEKLYKLEELDNPNGWEFKEIDMLGEMGFVIADEYKMTSEIEVPSLKMENEKVDASVYKTDEGYVLETNRRYVFETFNKMLEFMDSIPVKHF